MNAPYRNMSTVDLVQRAREAENCAWLMGDTEYHVAHADETYSRDPGQGMPQRRLRALFGELARRLEATAAVKAELIARLKKAERKAHWWDTMYEEDIP